MLHVALVSPEVNSHGSASSDLAWLVFLRDEFTCQLCHRQSRADPPESDLVADLIVPVAYGGNPEDVENRRTLCQRCLKALPRLEGIPPATPDSPTDLQRILAMPGVGRMVREWFREARLARQVRGRRYDFNESYGSIKGGILHAVGFGKRRYSWDEALSPEDREWLGTSQAYDAVMRNIQNLLPHDVR